MSEQRAQHVDYTRTTHPDPYLAHNAPWYYAPDNCERVSARRWAKDTTDKRGVPRTRVREDDDSYPWGDSGAYLLWRGNAHGSWSAHSADILTRVFKPKLQPGHASLFPNSFYDTICDVDMLWGVGASILEIKEQFNTDYPYSAGLLRLQDLLIHRAHTPVLCAKMDIKGGICDDVDVVRHPWAQALRDDPETPAWLKPREELEGIKRWAFYYALGLFVAADVPQAWWAVQPREGAASHRIDPGAPIESFRPKDCPSDNTKALGEQLAECYKGVCFLHPGNGLVNGLTHEAVFLHNVSNNAFDPQPYPSQGEDLGRFWKRFASQAQTWEEAFGKGVDNEDVGKLDVFGVLMGRQLRLDDSTRWDLGEIHAWVQVDDLPELDDVYGKPAGWSLPWTEENEAKGWTGARVVVLRDCEGDAHDPQNVWFTTEPEADSFVDMSKVPTIFIHGVLWKQVPGEDDDMTSNAGGEDDGGGDDYGGTDDDGDIDMDGQGGVQLHRPPREREVLADVDVNERGEKHMLPHPTPRASAAAVDSNVQACNGADGFPSGEDDDVREDMLYDAAREQEPPSASPSEVDFSAGDIGDGVVGDEVPPNTPQETRWWVYNCPRAVPWLILYKDPWAALLRGETLQDDVCPLMGWPVGVFSDGFNLVIDQTPECASPKGVYIEFLGQKSIVNEIYSVGLVPKSMSDYNWTCILEQQLVTNTFFGWETTFWNPVTEDWSRGRVYVLPVQWTFDLPEFRDMTGSGISWSASAGCRCLTSTWNYEDGLNSHHGWDRSVWASRKVLFTNVRYLPLTTMSRPYTRGPTRTVCRACCTCPSRGGSCTSCKRSLSCVVLSQQTLP